MSHWSNVKGISIRAWQGDHYVSLAEVLLTLGGSVLPLVWAIRVDEVAPEPFGDDLDHISSSQRLSMLELMRIIAPDLQLIDGEIEGYVQADDTDPSVVIRAVDSTWWDVLAEDSQVLERLREAFPDAIDLPV